MKFSEYVSEMKDWRDNPKKGDKFTFEGMEYVIVSISSKDVGLKDDKGKSKKVTTDELDKMLRSDD